jgi:hypothetical protein
MFIEAWAGIEPAHGGFANRSVTTSPPRLITITSNHHILCGRELILTGSVHLLDRLFRFTHNISQKILQKSPRLSHPRMAVLQTARCNDATTPYNYCFKLSLIPVTNITLP